MISKSNEKKKRKKGGKKSKNSKLNFYSTQIKIEKQNHAKKNEQRRYQSRKNHFPARIQAENQRNIRKYHHLYLKTPPLIPIPFSTRFYRRVVYEMNRKRIRPSNNPFFLPSYIFKLTGSLRLEKNLGLRKGKWEEIRTISKWREK